MRARLIIGAVIGALALTSVPASAWAAVEIEASWEMNEAPGATVMIDSGPNAINVGINQNGLDTGVAYAGAVGYRWAYRSPTAPPASPERVIVIPDNDNLDPGAANQTFAVEIRYRTKQKFGNIIQKGQSTSAGGQWKIQNPGGIPQCLFKGPQGQGGTTAKTALNDNAWHVLRCVKTPTAVEQYVDGVRVGRKSGVVGSVNNSFAMTIGGKNSCDQVKVTCDYFTGDIDYVRISRG